MKKAKLLWVDLEMTGLDPKKDKILEIAAVATDWKLNEIDRMRAVVRVDEKVMKERMVGGFWEKNSETRDALQKQNKEGEEVLEVERKVMDFLDKNFSKVVYLAGNSIHQDRKFIDEEWPEVSKRLHYRMLDVSAWKIYFEGALGREFRKPENHRAEDDIEGSIAELKYYLEFLK